MQSSGDARLDLWEERCTCGGSRKSPDVRMCTCDAPSVAGLVCGKCGQGVLLVKGGPRGNFWGCSNFRKGGCKHTKPFGPPHDRQAAAKLLGREGQEPPSNGETPRAGEGGGRRENDAAEAADPFEREWLENCRCGAARKLDTWSCFTRSEGGCGMFPICPAECGGSLFLRDSSYGSGKKWWACENHLNGCKFRRNYVVNAPNNGTSNPGTSHSKKKETVQLTEEQKKRIAANRAAALARRRAREVVKKRAADCTTFGCAVTPSPVSNSVKLATSADGNEAAAALSRHIDGVAGRGTKRSHDNSIGEDAATGE